MLDMFLSLTGTNSGNMEGRNSDLPPSSSHLAFIASLFMQIILYYIPSSYYIMSIVILFDLHIYSTNHGVLISILHCRPNISSI